MINKEFHKTKTDIKSELQEIEESKKNPKKFEILYNRYHEQIFRYLYSRVDNTHLAADLTSQVFYKALLNIENYSFKGVPFASWLYRIAYNEMNNNPYMERKGLEMSNEGYKTVVKLVASAFDCPYAFDEKIGLLYRKIYESNK